MRQHKIFVFLSNKLIMCDAVVPLMLELSDQFPEAKISFITFDKKTFDTIKRNHVLYGALKESSELIAPYRGNGRWARVVQALRIFMIFFDVIFSSIFRRATLIHGKALNVWPLKFLSFFTKNVFLLQSSPVGVSPSEHLASNLMQERKYSKVRPVAKWLLGFSEFWPLLEEYPELREKVMWLPMPHSAPSWKRYAQRILEQEFRREFAAAGLPESNRIIAFPLNSLGPSNLHQRSEGSLELLDRVLTQLSLLKDVPPIFLKPHPATTSEDYENLHRIVKKHRGLPILITYIHPTLLAQRALFAVAVNYTTTFGYFRAAGCPTVEFTDYRKDILARLNGKSMRDDLVDHFINDDDGAFLECARTLIEANRSVGANPVGTDLPWQPLGFLLGQPLIAASR